MLSVLLFAVFAVLIRLSTEHGYLMEPPSRSSAWRFGFDTPPNYTDNELNCGGFTRQWQTNGGKCGECGDAWDIDVGERPNQAGGTYATGTIVRHYQPGEMIDVAVRVTANHKGWFQFRLCAVNDYTQPVTWECLNQTLLELEDGSTKAYISDMPDDFYYKVRLPEITCSQCVFQWLWHCGNNNGKFPNGTECVGCGPQEQFYGCADIAIGVATTTAGPTGGSTISTTESPVSTTNTEATTTTTTQPGSTTTAQPGSTTTTQPGSTTVTQTGSTTTTQPGSTTTTAPREYECQFVGGTSEDMDDWCNDNCNHIPCYCPSDCVCEPENPSCSLFI